MKNSLKIIMAVSAAIAAVLVLNIKAQSTDDSGAVTVTNFPEVQQVSGALSISGTIDHAETHRWTSVLIPSVKRRDMMDGQAVGTVRTAGFSYATISLQGRTSDSAFKTGTVGVVFIPDEEAVLRAFNDANVIQFPMEVTCQVTASKSGYFSSETVRIPVAFPAYKIYVYNSSSTGVKSNIYLYLTN